MPPPLVTCEICKKSVLKAQTYHVGDGKRACKCHEGVLQKKDDLLEQDKAKKEQQKQEQERKQKAYAAKQDALQTPLKNRCWACHREALTRQEFGMRMMIAREKLEIKHTNANPLDPKYAQMLRQEMGAPKGEKVLVTELIPVRGNEKKIAKLPSQVQTMGSFAGVVNLCQDCQTNLGIEPFKMPELTLDQVMKFGAVYDVFTRPAVIQQALSEVIKETEQN